MSGDWVIFKMSEIHIGLARFVPQKQQVFNHRWWLQWNVLGQAGHQKNHRCAPTVINHTQPPQVSGYSLVFVYLVVARRWRWRILLMAASANRLQEAKPVHSSVSFIDNQLQYGLLVAEHHPKTWVQHFQSLALTVKVIYVCLLKKYLMNHIINIDRTPIK